MKFQFESSLPHQNKAIESVINLFEGIKTKSGIFSISRTQENFNLFNDTFQGFSNRIQTNNWVEEITPIFDIEWKQWLVKLMFF